MNKIVYKSKIDWWVWLTIAVVIAVAAVVIVDTSWHVALPLCGSMAICILSLIGCWYEIDGDNLIVYQFFRPHKFPIDKIAEIKKTKGYLATAGMSCRRVSIKFTDRTVMKSAMPLEISPKDRDSFIAHLHEINPNILIK